MKRNIITVIKILSFIIVWSVFVVIMPEMPTKNSAIIRLWYEIFPLFSTIVITVIFLIIIERNKLHVVIFNNFIKNVSLGIIVGIVWLAIPFFILLVTNNINYASKINIDYFAIWVLACFINVVMQELLVRGYIYQILKTQYNWIIAIIVTTLIFTALHGGAINAGVIPILNVITMSVMATLLMELTGTLSATIVSHFVWNFIGSIILGQVSLADDYPKMIKFTSKNNILTGWDYGLEGSLLVTIMNVILIMIFSMAIYKKNR